MKYLMLLILLSNHCQCMERGHIEAHSNGNSITIDIDSVPTELATRIAHAKQLPPDEPQSDHAKVKIAGITAGATICTAATAVCTALITAGVTVAITYSQCNK